MDCIYTDDVRAGRIAAAILRTKGRSGLRTEDLDLTCARDRFEATARAARA
ncbi:MAG: hypothetical protein ACLS4Z_04450 [Christensenellaceae bacterium]